MRPDQPDVQRRRGVAGGFNVSVTATGSSRSDEQHEGCLYTGRFATVTTVASWRDDEHAGGRVLSTLALPAPTELGDA